MQAIFYRVLVGMAIAGMALPVTAQVDKSQTATSSASQQPREKTPPYTAEYKTTEISVWTDGKTITHEWMEVDALDSEGRRLTADTIGNWIEKGEPVMRYHVYDPVAWTNTYWSVPGLHQATEEKKLPDGSDRIPCPEVVAAQQRARIDERLDALKVKLEASRQEKAAIDSSVSESPVPSKSGSLTTPDPKANQFIDEDLGVKTILGYVAEGKRMKKNGSSGFVYELWYTSAPGMHGITVRSSTESTSSTHSNVMTKELIKLTLGEPGMSFFQPPGNYEIVKTKEVGRACPSLQKLLQGAPPATPPAQ